MILGHEGCGVVDEVGSLVKDFKKGDHIMVAAITPDWSSLEAQAGFCAHSGGMLAGWKFSNFKDGVFGEYFHVNDAERTFIGILGRLVCSILCSRRCRWSYYKRRLIGKENEKIVLDFGLYITC